MDGADTGTPPGQPIPTATSMDEMHSNQGKEVI